MPPLAFVTRLPKLVLWACDPTVWPYSSPIGIGFVPCLSGALRRCRGHHPNASGHFATHRRPRSVGAGSDDSYAVSHPRWKCDRPDHGMLLLGKPFVLSIDE